MIRRLTMRAAVALGLATLTFSAVGTSALAFEGDGFISAQFTTTAQVPVANSRALVIRNSHGVTVLVAAKGLVPGQATVDTVVYSNPALCSGHFANLPTHTRCGGPGACPGLGAPFDVCNAANATVSITTTTVRSNGGAYTIMRIPTATNPKNAEVDVFLRQIVTTPVGPKLSTIEVALFASPAPDRDGQDGDQQGDHRDGDHQGDSQPGDSQQGDRNDGNQSGDSNN